MGAGVGAGVVLGNARKNPENARNSGEIALKWSQIPVPSVRSKFRFVAVHSRMKLTLSSANAVVRHALTATTEMPGRPRMPTAVALLTIPKAWSGPPNWPQHRIPSTNQHPVSTGTK